MAKRQPPKARRRTVKSLPNDLVQPGAVAAALTDEDDGLTTQADDNALTDDEKQQIREQVRLFMKTARDRFRMSSTAESELRRKFLNDMEFYDGDQWPKNIITDRDLDDRVSLTINRLPQFVRQVVNQARQSKPAIQINPIDDNADPETAEVLQGIVRNIERQSKAQVAYSTASEHQAIMGRGWWRVLAEYARDDSMEQEIRIKRILDSMTVYPDPSCEQPDNSDATFCFIVTRMNKTVYEGKYGDPDRGPISAHDFKSIGDDDPIWLNTDGVLVAEYYYVEHIKDRIAEVMFNAGAEPVRITVRKAMLKPEDLKPTDNGKGGFDPPKVVILKERDTVRKQVKWAVINGIEILEGNETKTAGRDIPGSYIPVVPVLGEELIVNGKRDIRGMVRDAISSQRAYNYWLSAITEKLALSTKAPVVAAVGQLEGLETKWNNANRRNYPYLEYNPIDVNGELVPPPQRAGYDPDISAALQMTMQADRDLKSVIGMFDASQERSPEQSGKAILARQAQGEQGTSHFLDNLARSIEHTGRILLEWIPIYYDTPRMLRINGLDEQEKTVVVHAGNAQAATDLISKMDDKLRQNIMEGRPFDLAVGRYDVTISVGPSYQSKRQEAVNSIVALVQANPNIAPWVLDILVGNMDWPGARQLAERLKKMVPPEAQDAPNGQDIPPQVQRQMQQMQQQIQLLLGKVQELTTIINTKAQELAMQGRLKQLDIAARERETYMKLQGDLAMTEVKANTDKGIALLKSTLDEIKLRLEHHHDREMKEFDAAHMTPPGTGGEPGGGAGAEAGA